MNVFLYEVSTHISEGEYVVLTVDGAGWHKGKGLLVQKTITIIIPPSYSLDLNSIERVWRYVRSHWLSNRVFEDLKGVFDACEDAWKRFIAEPDFVRSVCRATWADTA